MNKRGRKREGERDKEKDTLNRKIEQRRTVRE
jgi:hypothetical protein